MTIFYVDVETLGPQDDTRLADAEQLLSPPSNYKKEDAIAKWRTEQADKLALHAWANEPVSIAWAWDEGEVQTSTRLLDEGAREFWLSAVDMVRDSMYSSIDTVRVAGWNVGFDLGCLRSWAMSYEAKFPIHLPSTKFSPMAVDVMDLYNPWERTSLRKAAWATGLGVYDDSGAEVAEQWKRGDIWSINLHNKMDVERTRHIHERVLSYI